MENFNQQPPRAGMRGWLVLLLAVAVALLAAYFPVVLVAAPALWAYAGARTKPYWMILPAAVFTAGLAAFESPVVVAGLAGAAALAAVLLYVLLTQRMSNTDTALILAGVFLIGLYAAICLPGILAGRGAYADIQAVMSSMIEFYRSAFAQMPQVNADTAKTIMDAMDEMYLAVPTSFVAVLCIFASVLGLSNLLFFRLFCRKHPEIAISPIRPFRDWTLSRSLTLGLFVMLIGSLILEFAGWAFAESLAITVNILVALPLLLQGLCVVDFFISRSKKNVTVWRALAYVCIVILFRVVFYPLLLAGCFDQIFRLRQRMRGVPPRAAV